MTQQPKLFQRGVVWAAVTDPIKNKVAFLKQPLLIAHGQKDKVVPIAQAEGFRKAMQMNNANSEWLSYADEGHQLIAPSNQIDFWNRTARFLDNA